MSGGGSVRAARERMDAGLRPDMPRGPPPPMYDPTRQAQNPNRPRPQMAPITTSKSSGQSMIGVAISRPTQVPQWPLSGAVESQEILGAQQYQPPPGRGPAPQRPPRPSHVPSILDASQLQDHTPSFQYRPQQHAQEQQTMWRPMSEDDYDTNSPDMSSPMTPSSRVSTISSVGTIPDFPVPVVPPRRSVHLGPPPSSRRGASSYYSQASFVSPIPEESPRTQTTHRSYASSAAIPSSWGSEYEYDDETPEAEFERDFMHGRGDSRDSNNFEEGDERGLIRSASMGKRAKPSMINTKSSERMEQVRPSPQPQQASKLDRMGVFDPNSGKVPGNAGPTSPNNDRDTLWPMSATASSNILPMSSNPSKTPGEMVWPMVSSPLAGGTGLIDPSTSSSETVPTLAYAITTDERVSPISNSPESDNKSREMLGANNLAPAGAGLAASRTPSPSGFSRLSAIRRPPRLDIDAVRDAEARGSLTSLPDLIRRATRLAAMMDRGKRPGSRLNDLTDFPMDEKDFERDFPARSPEPDKHRSGLSGMLASFPPPGAATPRTGTPNNSNRPLSAWPQSYPDMDRDGSEKKASGKRRCCGLPCWGIIVILIILLIIIAAAVVVPVKLLVIDKTPTAQAETAGQQCQTNTATACQNGGLSLIDNGSCACVCTNGFTGTTCNVVGATGCTTTTLGSLSNVTMGDSIPRLISTAAANFSVPLTAETLIARFNTANLSCGSENALVTFDGLSTRSGNANDIVTPVATDTPSATQKVRRTAVPSSTIFLIVPSSVSSAAAASSATATNSIIVDTSTVPTATASATSSAINSDPTAVFAVTEEVLDFARVAVLYIMQQKSLDNAVTAQSSIQSFISKQAFTNRAAMNIPLGNSNTINLVAFTMDIGNGTVGKNRTAAASTSSTSSRTKMRRDKFSRNLWR